VNESACAHALRSQLPASRDPRQRGAASAHVIAQSLDVRLQRAEVDAVAGVVCLDEQLGLRVAELGRDAVDIAQELVLRDAAVVVVIEIDEEILSARDGRQTKTTPWVPGTGARALMTMPPVLML
jgi:hypothetical protein